MHAGDARRGCTPAHQIESLHAKDHRLDNTPVTGERPLAGIGGDLFEITADLDVGAATEVGLIVRGEPIVYAVNDHALTALGTAPLTLTDGHLRLRLLVDRTSIETFADGGRVSLTSCFLPRTDGISVVARGGTATVRSMVVTELRSAVKRRRLMRQSNHLNTFAWP